jgi:chromosome segregation ATPase
MPTEFTGYSISQDATLTEITNRIINNESTVTSNNTTVLGAISDINTKDTQQNGRLDALDARKESLDTRQANIETGVTSLTTTKNNLNTAMDGISSRYTALVTTSAQINTGLNGIESTITSKLAEIATKADASDFELFQTDLNEDGSTLQSMLAARILASLQSIVDAGQGLRDKLFEERFFALEEFIRMTLATNGDNLGYKIDINNNGTITPYEYKGVVQGLVFE